MLIRLLGAYAVITPLKKTTVNVAVISVEKRG